MGELELSQCLPAPNGPSRPVDTCVKRQLDASDSLHAPGAARHCNSLARSRASSRHHPSL